MRISDWSSDVCSSDLRRGLEVQGEADHRHGRARLYGRIRREDLQAARRLRQLWLSRKPCGELRSHRLCVLLAQMLASGDFLRQPPQRAADGILDRKSVV